MELLEAADNARDAGNHEQAVSLYRQAMNTPIHSIDDYDTIRVVEVSLFHLAEMYATHKKSSELADLVRNVTTIFISIPKAKTAKIIRKLFDYCGTSGMSLPDQRDICSKLVEWARAEKRSFLRHRLQCRLALILFELQLYTVSLQTITTLLREVRRLDDKALLVEIHLLESRVYYFLRNMSKARAALVSARTNANAIYCPPLLQAELDMQAGVLYMEEKDSKTAYSYFFEAFEGYHAMGDFPHEALRGLKYMLLCKVLHSSGDEINNILQSKSVMKYSSRVVDAMRSLSAAYKKRDTQSFKSVKAEYHDILGSDPVVASYLDDLYDTLLEKHLLKITEPYSVVQIDFVASLVQLGADEVEAKLSQMILDKKMNAILDQKDNCLVLEVDPEDSTAAEDASQTVENLSRVVDALFDKVGGKIAPVVDVVKSPKKDKKKDGEKNAKDNKDGK
eukprot:PhF_6_TR19639/c0_g1_i1/m.28653/K03036/PSMD11, RPN6; 26S proteasome regulatory subunit N6